MERGGRVQTSQKIGGWIGWAVAGESVGAGFDAVGDHQDLVAATASDFVGGQQRFARCVVLGDLRTDADAGVGVTEQDRLQSADEWPGVGLAEPNYNRRGGVGRSVRGGWSVFVEEAGWPESAEPAGGGLQGVVEEWPAIGPYVGEVGAEQEAVDKIDAIDGLCLEECLAGPTIGDAIGGEGQEAEGDGGGLEFLHEGRLGWRGGGIQTVDRDPVTAALQAEGEPYQVLFGTADLEFRDKQGDAAVGAVGLRSIGREPVIAIGLHLLRFQR